MARLTKDRENKIREILKYFLTIQAEKRTDMRSPPELVDMKPFINELLGELEVLRNDAENTKTVMSKVLKEKEDLIDSKKKLIEKHASVSAALDVAKEALSNSHKNAEPTDAPPTVTGTKHWFKDVLSKIKELEKK